MKAFIVSMILLIGLLLGCSSLEFNKQAQVENLAWLDMCQLLIDEEVGYACGRLMQPEVVYETMRDGLLGYYEGGNTIYINDTLQSTEKFEVLMHEGIHYVHVQLGIIEVPGPAQQVCWSENEAWTLTGSFYNEDNSNWWRAYPYCWQYYADNQYLKDLGWLYNEVNDIVDGIIFED